MDLLKFFLEISPDFIYNIVDPNKKAAEESHITPTAVIKQIDLLEYPLVVKLFERSHRGLILTKAGRSLYQDSKYIIQYCRDPVTRAKNTLLERSDE